MKRPLRPRRRRPPMTAAQRRDRVAELNRQGLSNRAIAERLQCDDHTVADDLKYLRTPEDQRPVKIPRQKKVKTLTPEQRFKQSMKVGKEWFLTQNLNRNDVLFVVSETSSRINRVQTWFVDASEPTVNPAELLPQAKPETTPNFGPGEMPEKLEYCRLWFTRWVFMNFPEDDKTRDRVLSGLQKWAEKELPLR